MCEIKKKILSQEKKKKISDNGKNFILVDRELSELMTELAGVLTYRVYPNIEGYSTS